MVLLFPKADDAILRSVFFQRPHSLKVIKVSIKFNIKDSSFYDQSSILLCFYRRYYFRNGFLRCHENATVVNDCLDALTKRF